MSAINDFTFFFGFFFRDCNVDIVFKTLVKHFTMTYILTSALKFNLKERLKFSVNIWQSARKLLSYIQMKIREKKL